jgi:endonuclease G, mitochondrial
VISGLCLPDFISIPSPLNKLMSKPPDFSEQDLEAALQTLEQAAAKPYYDAQADEQNRNQYYAQLLGKFKIQTGAKRYQGAIARYQELQTLVTQTHTRKLSYQPAKHLYPWVDLHPDLQIYSIYSEQKFEPKTLIQMDFQSDRLRTLRTEELEAKPSLLPNQLTQELAVLEAALPYNCEHVVPQSWFGKAEPMRGDLHHLFACESRCNSFRGNTPYFDFPDFQEVIRDQCGKVVGDRFEPTGGKGAVARATFYFLLRYPGLINQTQKEYTEDRLKTLLDWHRAAPVTDYERHRNAAIFAIQGNRNPLIDFPEWAEKIAFSLGLG